MPNWRKISFGWKLLFIKRKTKSLTKKAQYEPRKITLQYRNDYLVKKTKKALKIFRINLTVKGYENVGNGPAIIIANHQDNVDAVLLLYALKKQTEAHDDLNKIPTFLAKHTLQYNKITNNILSSINTFFLNRNDIKKSLETYQDFGKFVKENKTFGVIFAEGTRNTEGDIAPFKPGSFKVAKKELLPIIPVTINNSVQGSNLDRKEHLDVEIIFHKKIPASSLITQNTVAISERVYNIVKSVFKKPELSSLAKEKEDEAEIENSKGALKWKKQEAKKEMKKHKKQQRELRQEQRLIEAEKKEDEKYEKYQSKINKKKSASYLEENTKETDERGTDEL